jgi:hypothetical protein
MNQPMSAERIAWLKGQQREFYGWLWTAAVIIAAGILYAAWTGGKIAGLAEAQAAIEPEPYFQNESLKQLVQHLKLENDVLRRQLLDEKTKEPRAHFKVEGPFFGPLLPAEDRFLPDLK